MTPSRDAAAMRNPRAASVTAFATLIVTALGAAACAGRERPPADAAPEPVVERPAAPVIKVYDVRDLVTSPDPARHVAELAGELRTAAVFLHGADETDAKIVPNGTALVVVAPPRVHEWVQTTLDRRRADVADTK